jgi:predicted nucleotidyltransferase
LAFLDLANRMESVLHKKVDLYRRDQLIAGGKVKTEVEQTGIRLYEDRL